MGTIITFVTRKITRALARIVLGLEQCVYLGNLNARRDWGHARDYVEMQWLILQQEQPEDFVIATGEQHSVREFIDLAARELGITLRWEGQGVDEIGVVAQCTDETPLKVGQVIVRVDPGYFRPTEVDTLLGDAGKARAKLGWQPRITFQELVSEMMQEDMKMAQRDELVNGHGYAAFKHYYD